MNRDAGLIRLIRDWAPAWLNSMRQTGHGKPAGIFPSVVRAADGSYLAGSSAGAKSQAEWDYFQWSGGSRKRRWRRCCRRAREMEGRLAVNFDMFTSDPPWTDRVYCRRPAELRQHPPGGGAPHGDRYPAVALTWPPAKGEFSRAAAAAGPARLALAAYNIEGGVLMAPVRLNGLPHEMEFPLPPPAGVSTEVKRDQP